jgi:hypothetical protein
MAKKVSFSAKPKGKKVDTSFDFGFNKLSKTAKKAYRKAAGHGGS